jgi:hypothetical protein
MNITLVENYDLVSPMKLLTLDVIPHDVLAGPKFASFNIEFRTHHAFIEHFDKPVVIGDGICKLGLQPELFSKTFSKAICLNVSLPLEDFEEGFDELQLIKRISLISPRFINQMTSEGKKETFLIWQVVCKVFYRALYQHNLDNMIFCLKNFEGKFQEISNSVAPECEKTIICEHTSLKIDRLFQDIYTPIASSAVHLSECSFWKEKTITYQFLTSGRFF